MQKIVFISIFIASFFSSKAQLADGSTAPDFTLKDINGHDVNLYGYLNDGKTVYLDIFAAHCPICWAYHNTNALRDLYNDHGQAGTLSQDIMVIAIEHDPLNGMNELTGISGATAGDWVTGTQYPIINPEGIDRSNFITAYDAVFYPMIYAICPDRTIKLIGTQTALVLYDHVASCGVLGYPSVEKNKLDVFYNSIENTIQLNNLNALEKAEIVIFDVSGKLVLSTLISSNTISFSQFDKGIYLYKLRGNLGTSINGKFYKN